MGGGNLFTEQEEREGIFPERKIRVPLGVTFICYIGQEGRKAVFNLDYCKTGNNWYTREQVNHI